MKKRRRERNGWWVIKEFFHYVNISGRAAFSCCCCLLSAPWYIYTCVCVQTPQRRKPPSLLKKKGKKRLCKNLLLRDGAYLKGKRGVRGTGADEVRRWKVDWDSPFDTPIIWCARHERATDFSASRHLFFPISGKRWGNQKTFSPPSAFAHVNKLMAAATSTWQEVEKDTRSRYRHGFHIFFFSYSLFANLFSTAPKAGAWVFVYKSFTPSVLIDAKNIKKGGKYERPIRLYSDNNRQIFAYYPRPPPSSIFSTRTPSQNKIK